MKLPRLQKPADLMISDKSVSSASAIFIRFKKEMFASPRSIRPICARSMPVAWARFSCEIPQASRVARIAPPSGSSK